MRSVPLVLTLALRLLSVLAVVWPLAAGADWPMARHDPQRSGTSSQPVTISTPVVQWRRYLGGALSRTQMLARDVDQDGSTDVVLISGGKLVAKQPDDTVIWETPPLGLEQIHQVADFDGDGQDEIVVTGERALLGLFSARTGALLWRMQPGTFGTIVGAVRIADLNHDGKPDLYAADTACGSINGNGRAIAWSFAAGFKADDGSQRLWELPRNRDYYCGWNDVVADLDGDGKVEVVAFSSQSVFVYDGETGQSLDATAGDAGFPLPLTIPFGTEETTLADVDGNGTLSIIGATNNSYDVSINSRAMLVLSWNRSQTPRLSTRWFHNAADLVNDVHNYIDEPAVDLDGDGKAEIVSTWFHSGQNHAFIFNGATGVALSVLDGAVIVGGTKLSPTELPTLLVQVGGELRGYRFDHGFGAGFGTPAFSLPAANTAVTVYDPDKRRAGSMSLATLTVPLPSGGGRRGLVLANGDTYQLWDTTQTSAPLATYTLPAGVKGLSLAPQSNVSYAGPGVLVARSDGFLIALDATFKAVNFTGGGSELGLPGVRTGGYYSGWRGTGTEPIAGKLGQSYEELLVYDSLAQLLRLDASHASLVKAPEVQWSWQHAAFPTLLDTRGTGTRDLIVAREDGAWVGHRPDAGVAFELVAPGGGWYSLGFPLVLDGGAEARFADSQFNSGTGEGRVVTYSTSGQVWSSTPIVTAGSGQGLLTADDLDGDGVQDAYGLFGASLLGFSGATGAALGGGAAVYSSLPITVRGRAGAVNQIAAASIYEMQGLSSAQPFTGFTHQWSVAVPETLYVGYSAVLDCPDAGLVVVGTGYASPRFIVTAAEQGAVRSEVLLSAGALLEADAGSADGGVAGGSLGNVTGVSGPVPLALVGSTDGYLYAVEVCAAPARLRWAVNLRAPVGEPIVADYNGDGVGEIVVEAADGFVYGINQQRFPAPAQVDDVDDDQPGVAGDVDETHADHLSARWTSVPGVTSYQYAVFTAGGTPLTRNPMDPGDPFITVPPEVTTAQHAQQLQSGSRYFFAVRAVGATGASSETLSDGTRWVPMSAADAGPATSEDGGSQPDAGHVTMSHAAGKCGCSAGAGAEGLLALALLLRRRAQLIRSP